MKWGKTSTAALLLLALLAETLNAADTLRCGFNLAAFRIADMDGDGRSDLVCVGKAGEVRMWHGGADSTAWSGKGAGRLELPHPARSLMALADLLGQSGPLQLAVLSPDGLSLYRPGPDGGFPQEGLSLAPGARFLLRVGAPRFVDFITDANNDGMPDLQVPGARTCDLWLQESAKEAEGEGSSPPLPAFRRTAAFAVEVAAVHTLDATLLSDSLESGFSIPYLRLRDINGDGLPDLTVVENKLRNFRLQRKDGSFPEKPDATLNLDIFRDTTPEGEIRFGKTLAGEEDPRLQIADLDRDGIPDYVIFHRRKLWIFYGTTEGPQFTEPASILKVAEDVTALQVTELDEDSYPDLLLLKVQVPAIAGLLKGLFSELEIEIFATGYANREGRAFTEGPAWKGRITVRIPDVLDIIRNPDALFSRLEEEATRFRNPVRGDFDGDGREDLALLSTDGTRIEVWKTDAAMATAVKGAGLRSLFFGSKEPSWTLEELLDRLGNVERTRTLRNEEGRGPGREIPLRDSLRYPFLGFESADLDGGNGRSTIVAVYRDRKEQGEGVFDLHRLE
jgi:hypothetical protein